MEQKTSNDLRRPVPEEIGTVLEFPDKLPEIEGFYYLAGPYGHISPAVIEQRMVEYEATDATLSAIGYKTISPLAKHHILKYDNTLGGDFNFWKDYCLALLEVCQGMVVVMIDGWLSSKGVWAEIEHAQKFGIPVYFLYPVT